MKETNVRSLVSLWGFFLQEPGTEVGGGVGLSQLLSLLPTPTATPALPVFVLSLSPKH